MAMTREYLELVESGIDIAPVGSQEEFQAAEYMLDAFEEHGLETEFQDLTAPLYSRVILGIALVLMLVAAVLCGLGGIGWALGGFLGALVLGFYLASDYLGTNPLENFGPRAESQNVIGIHRGEGPRAGRGVRPIVVLCRYDTGREQLFANPAIAQFVPNIMAMAPWCVVAVVIGTALQLLQFMAGPALVVLWILTIIAAVPLAAIGANEVTASFLNLTDGANDNKASLGALLGVLEDVRPTDVERVRLRAAQLAEAEQANVGVEPGDDGRFYEEYEAFEDVPVIGARHGRQVLQSIGMLPPTCDIVYEEPGKRRVIKRRVVEMPSPLSEGEQPTEEDLSITRSAAGDGPKLVVVSDRKVNRDRQQTGAGTGEETAPIDLPSDMAGADEGSIRRARESATDAQRSQMDAAGVDGWGVSEFHGDDARTRRSLLFDLPDPSVEASDPLLAEVESVDIPEAQPTELVTVVEDAVEPEPLVEDDAGHRHGLFGRKGSDGAPKRSLRDRLHFGHRKKREESEEWLEPAEEYDGGVSSDEMGDWDDYGEEDDWMGGATRSSDSRGSGDPRERLERIRALADDIEAEIVDHSAERQAERDFKDGADPFEVVGEGADAHDRPRMAEVYELTPGDDVSEEQIDEAAEEAAMASLDVAPRLGANGEEIPVPDVEVLGSSEDDELVESVLEMGDVNLVSHDIWFVCVGASALGHAGTKAFIKAHRRELRGCLLINLDSIGAGDLTAITSEGYGDTRRGDRKTQKLLDTASKVIHVPITLASHEWEDTDATPALRRSMRGLTLMGTVGGKQRALANTADDIAENLNPNQVVYVSQLVSEIIRRA